MKGVECGAHAGDEGYRRLQQVLRWGVELVAIEGVIIFKQAP